MGWLKEPPHKKLKCAHSPNDVTAILVVAVEITRREIDGPSVGLAGLGTGPPRRSCIIAHYTIVNGFGKDI